jgi:hypothetical protein
MANQYRSLAAASGNFNGGAAGTHLHGTALRLENVKPGSLSAYFDTTATTSTLTISGFWEVSADNSTWVDVSTLNNAALVAITTGTGSAVTGDKVIPFPDGLLGWKYARATAINGVTTGATADAAVITYRWLNEQSGGW